MKRRNFLLSSAALGISYYPISRLIDSLIKSDRLKEDIKLSIGETKNYIQIHMYGGPTRWSFDHFLNPYSDGSFYNHPMIFNEYDQSRDILDQPYNFIQRNGINSSSFIKNLIPTTNKENVEISNIFKNSFTMRGVHMEGTTGHPMNSSKVIASKIGGLSIDGLIGDKSKRPISCISIGSSPVNRAFKSRSSSVAKVPSDKDNYLNYLLSPFHSPGKSNISSKDIEPYLEEAMDTLRRSDSNSNYKKDLFKAKSFFKESIKDFLEQYDSLVQKYENLINLSLKTQIINVTDKVIKSPKLPLIADGNKSLEDLLGPYTLYNNFLLDDDLRNFFSGVNAQNMAKEFALSEFVLVNGISTSIVISTANEIGNFFEGQKSKFLYDKESISAKYNKKNNTTSFNIIKKPKNEGQPLSFDSHSTGSLINMVTCSKYFHCLSTCLNELINTLKKTKVENSNLFNETIIHLTSEFDRAPRLSCDGSDHNEQAHVSTIFNGNIKEQFVIGNIFSGSNTSKEELGTWGNSAPVNSLKDSRVGISNVSSTLSELIGIPKVIKRSQSLVRYNNGFIEPTIEKAKNIEGTYEDYNS